MDKLKRLCALRLRKVYPPLFLDHLKINMHTFLRMVLKFKRMALAAIQNANIANHFKLQNHLTNIYNKIILKL